MCTSSLPPPRQINHQSWRTQFLETESKVADFVAVINDLRDFVYGQPTSLTLTALLDQLKVPGMCHLDVCFARVRSCLDCVVPVFGPEAQEATPGVL